MQSRTTLERKIGATIGLDSSVLRWLVRHAAWTLTTFHVGDDRMTAQQRIRGKPFNQQIAAFGEQILFKPHKAAGPQQKLAVNWMDGCWLGFNTRTEEHIVSNNAAVVTCRSIRRRNKEDRWHRERLLGILGNPWSLQDGRVEVDRDPAAPARHIPMVNPEVKPTVMRTRSEEHGRRIYITKKLVSEFGATLGCKGCLMIGQPHTEECRARINARMESDPVHTKRLEDKLNRRNEFANPETTVAVPIEGRADATKRARQSELEPPQESANTGGSSSSSAGAEVDMRVTHAGKRPLEPDGDEDMVCGLDVCDELDASHFVEMYVNDCEEDYAGEVTEVTLRRDDVAKSRMEEMKWYERFNAFEEVTDETGVSMTGRKPISCRWRVINKGDKERVEVRRRLVAREIKQKGTDSYFAGTPPLALVMYVISRIATLSKTGKRRQLMELDAKRAFLHADALTETYVKPPHLRDTERCWLLTKCMYSTGPAAAGWQHLVRRIGKDIGLLSSSSCPCAFHELGCACMTELAS